MPTYDLLHNPPPRNWGPNTTARCPKVLCLQFLQHPPKHGTPVPCRPRNCPFGGRPARGPHSPALEPLALSIATSTSERRKGSVPTLPMAGRETERLRAGAELTGGKNRQGGGGRRAGAPGAGCSSRARRSLERLGRNRGRMELGTRSTAGEHLLGKHVGCSGRTAAPWHWSLVAL